MNVHRPMPSADPFRVAADNAADTIIITSSDLDAPGPRIEYVNPAFSLMTGYAPSEVVGRSPRLLQGPETDRAVLDRLRRDLARLGHFNGRTVNYRKDGRPYLVEWLVAPVLDAGNEVSRWIAIQRDVSAQNGMEDAERRLLSELQGRGRVLPPNFAAAGLAQRSSPIGEAEPPANDR